MEVKGSMDYKQGIGTRLDTNGVDNASVIFYTYLPIYIGMQALFRRERISGRWICPFSHSIELKVLDIALVG